MKSLMIILSFLLIIPNIAAAQLTPIARYDVVPRQRLEAGEIFSFGVIAFSKAGIDNVQFTITPSSGSYSDTSPVSVSSMTLNDRTSVWEYWIPINANDFDTDTSFTVRAVITGNDGGTRDLGTINMFANPGGTLATYSAWVDSVNGVDATGTLDDETKPYLTIDAALDAIEAANSNEVGGCFIYLEEGTYGADWASHMTTNEWLTIRAAPGATKENVRIQNMQAYGTYLKVSGVQLERTASFALSEATDTLWIDDCNCIGSGRGLSFSEVVVGGTIDYATDSYFTDSEWGVIAPFARGCETYKIAQDNFQNSYLVVNCSLNDTIGSQAGAHSDAVQYFSLGAEIQNRIVYNYKATNLGYQGVFFKGWTTQGTVKDLAFVNVLVHMTSETVEGGGAFYWSDEGRYLDHVLMWHCTVLNQPTAIWDGVYLEDCSMIGNVIHELASGTDPAPQFVPGNPYGNEALHNHFETHDDLYHAAYADSDSGGTITTGDPGINTGIDPINYDYARPIAGSPLIERIPFNIIPSDMLGNPRDSFADVGALEFIANQNCSVLGGTCCSSGQLCQEGSYQSSNDCGSLCCVGGICEDPPECGDSICDSGETCAADECCDGQTYDSVTEVCCLGSVQIGECCSNTDCTNQDCVNYQCMDTCISLGYECCDICLSGQHPEYDSDCSGQVCCEACIPQGTSYSYKAQEVIRVDADASEWTDAVAYDIKFIVFGNPTPTDLSGWFKTMWDDDNLYIFVEVTDDSLINDGDYWDDDTIGIHIDGLNDEALGMAGGDDMKIALIYNDHLVNGKGDVVDPPEWSSLLNSTVITANGYAAEFSIPFSLFNVSPTEDYVMGFDIAIYDDDDGGMLDHTIRWNSSATTGPYTDEDTSLFGDLILKQSQYHRSDTDTNGCVELDEMISFMDRWKISSADVRMHEMMESIGLWKTGTGCS